MTTRSSWLRGVALILLTGLGSGCDALGVTGKKPIIDNWGIAGYARLTGTVSHADGTRYGVVSVSYRCGDPDPNWFGYTANTSAEGAFDIAVDAPAAGTLPASGTLVCEVRSPAYSPTGASARGVVAFSQSADARPVTTFTLVDSAGSP